MLVKEPSIGDFFSVLAFRPQANAVYEHKKRGFTKMVPRADVFAGLLFSCNRTKTEVFEYDDLIHHTVHYRIPCKGCYSTVNARISAPPKAQNL